MENSIAKKKGEEIHTPDRPDQTDETDDDGDVARLVAGEKLNVAKGPVLAGWSLSVGRLSERKR